MNSQRGFNLIDLLIGLAISLFGLLAVGQILLSFTQQRNTITQTLEAQSNGVLAQYLIEKDLTQAGYALMSIQDCAQINWYLNGTGHYNNPYVTSALAAFTTLPVRITDGGAGNSDTLEIQYGNAASGAPVTVATQTQAGGYGTPIEVASREGFAAGNLIVTDVGGTCTMGQIAEPTTGPPASLNRPTGAGYPYNTDSRPGAATTGWDAAVANTTLVANLGNFVSRRYQIINEALQMADYSTDYTYNNLVDGIVFMKAEYGVDAAGGGVVTEWRKGTAANNVAALGNQVIAVRIGLVARSPLLERDQVTDLTKLEVLPAITTPSAAAVNYVPDAANAANFRYRTYYTVIPLRNVIWSR